MCKSRHGPTGVEYRPNQVWGWDAIHFPRDKWIALAIIDLVSRKWVATLVTQDDALDAARLSAETERRALSPVEHDAELPIPLAVSDNGPQMTSGTWAAFELRDNDKAID